jgi:hypothetical protein
VDAQPVRGQNVPDVQVWGMQKVVRVLQRPPMQAALAGQSSRVAQLH